MNRDIQSFPYTLGNQGLLLKSAADEVPLTAYLTLYNSFTDRENSLTVRRGYAQIGSTPGNKNAPNGYIKTSTASYRYCRSTTDWCRATILTNLHGDYNSIASGLSGNPALVTSNILGNNPYIFLADGTKFLKDYGTGMATNVGIQPPSVTLTAEKASLTGSDIIIIDNFESGIASWNAALQTGGGTCSQSLIDGFDGGQGLRLTLSDASSIGRTSKDFNINMGDNDDLAVEFYVRWPTDADAAHALRASIKFSLGDNTFSTTYEKTLTTHTMQVALASQQYSADTYQDAQYQLNQEILASQIAKDASIEQTISNTEYQQKTQFDPQSIPLGSGVWNVVRVAKSDFIRSGITGFTDDTLTWADVQAVGIELVSDDTLGCSIDIDKITYRAVGLITGSNIAYAFTYYDNISQSESDYSDIVQIPLPGADHDEFLITFTDTPDANATHRRLYRIGGIIEQFQKVADIPISTLTYVDNVADLSLGDVLPLDNQAAAGIPRGVEAFDNRLFIWGISTEPSNRLRFSKRNLLENFPTDYYIPVGNGSEKIIRCVEYDGELYIFTNSRVYRLIGTDNNSYRAISTQINIGLVSITGVAKSITGLYLAAQDGIYEFPSGKRISEAINSVWRGQTSNGIQPFILENMKYVALGYFNQKLYVSYITQAGVTGNSDILVYDLGYERWHNYGYGCVEFFSEPADTDLNKPNMFLGGVMEGEPAHDLGPYIVELETGNVDEKFSITEGILWGLMTKELDMGSPDKEKQLIDLVIDMDTGNSDTWVGYALDSGSLDVQVPTYIQLGTIPADSSGRKQYILPFPNQDGESVYATRISIKIKGTTLVDRTYNNQTKVFKIIPRFLIEPPKHRSFITDWADEGSPDEKIWRELHIEYNSYGRVPIFHLEIDGVEVYQWTGTASSYRKKFYYSFPTSPDMIGTLARVRMEVT